MNSHRLLHVCWCKFSLDSREAMSLKLIPSQKKFLGGTLGGGVGRYQGLHGLISDNLLTMQMVTAAGKLINVSATENSDLFWGMRGAGFNFGVVIHATYRVFPLTNGGEVQVADFIFNKEQNETFFKTLASLSGTLPPELALLTYVDFNITYGGVSTHFLPQTITSSTTDSPIKSRPLPFSISLTLAQKTSS